MRLRLLETTDLHAHLLPYDYYRDAADETVGLARVASLIGIARQEVRNCLLFDNGDFLQGAPVGDLIAFEKPLQPGEVHPVIAAMNRLGYDAGTIGNHEFNYGLPYFERAIADASFPVVSANVARGALAASALEDATLAAPYVILDREVEDERGGRHALRIGVIGFTPPQIMQWDENHLRGLVGARGILDAAKAWLPRIRAQDVDLLVALAHTGIGGRSSRDDDEDVGLALAGLPGIDAIFLGHAHQLFPGPLYADIAGADAVSGTLDGVPAVMAGYAGAHLGLIDLTLRKEDGRFRVSGHAVCTRPIYSREGAKVVALARSAPAIVEASRSGHEQTLAYMRKPVGRSSLRLDSYFALVTDTAAMQLISQAQLWYARPLLTGEHARLPLLSATAPFKAGGRGGVTAYTDVPAGEIALRNVADIYVFPNTLMVVKVTGAQVHDWLERSAGVYRRIEAGDHEQMLIEEGFAAYNFDIIDGLTYRIDVSQPSRFDGDGLLAVPGARRIVDLSHEGRPVQPQDVFAVVTNSYRANGGGSFAGCDGSTVILTAPDYSRDVVRRYLAQASGVSPSPDHNWSIAPMPSATRVVFDSSPLGRDLIEALPRISVAGPAPDGFLRYRLDMSRET